MKPKKLTKKQNAVWKTLREDPKATLESMASKFNRSEEEVKKQVMGLYRKGYITNLLRSEDGH